MCVSIMCDTSNCIQSQVPNQEASQQLPVQSQQSSTQKSHPANATPTTISADQHITMSMQWKATVDFTFSASAHRVGESRGQPEFFFY